MFNLFFKYRNRLTYFFILFGMILVLYLMVKYHYYNYNEKTILFLETNLETDTRKMIPFDEYIKWQRLLHSFKCAAENLKTKDPYGYYQLDELIDYLLELLEHWSFYDNNVISEVQRERFKFLLCIFFEYLELFTVDHPTIGNRLDLLNSIPALVEDASDIYHKMKSYRYD